VLPAGGDVRSRDVTVRRRRLGLPVRPESR